MNAFITCRRTILVKRWAHLYPKAGEKEKARSLDKVHRSDVDW